jgi:hypothetical protein
VGALARPKRLLSKRAAARAVGIDRRTTLEGLLRDGQLRMVLRKIPDTEIERLLTHGIPEQKPRAWRQPASAR